MAKKIYRMRRKTRSKFYATDVITIPAGASVSPVISISGGRDFYLTEIVPWISENIEFKDVRIKFEDNTTDANWQDKEVSIQALVNNDRRLNFQRDLAHKTDVTLGITNNTVADLDMQIVFIGYEFVVRPEGDNLTTGM